MELDHNIRNIPGAHNHPCGSANRVLYGGRSTIWHRSSTPAGHRHSGKRARSTRRPYQLQRIVRSGPDADQFPVVSRLEGICHYAGRSLGSLPEYSRRRVDPGRKHSALRVWLAGRRRLQRRHKARTGTGQAA